MKDSMVLELIFLDAAGKTRKITINQPTETINKETAEAVMQTLVDCDLFKDEKGLDMYATPVAARYVERNVTDVYAYEEA
ncbi:DUF2922 domain-containing protein [Facklamia sp. 7083-14-GEN3]|uniref:DUF2922 domain-containing protein n=1 Tax=Facklamia sp. 7083-14-GEN3 TaxID=2973478 RepID=UPI00215C1194|nr:DUF2922 domain-containing protein [Facklamia sp. 7083-14-GEN3]MCR8968923.1 DUF2922 domain-containing protein [Facklamia sp. 7083-14-GEN3]